ncbi:sugar kinase [Radiobacillus sp. PE A8.2]|uniref:sugar kinase n=1 Tax=Radiobacillus sp. PE A8.2 TaxID=3380349 RepID=UPI00388F7B73
MDVITLGESMVLFKPDSLGPLRYVNGFSKTVGGAESNLAVALTRLGHQVGWVSKLGNDEFGLYVRNTIRGEGVETSRVLFDDHAPTAVFFKERKSNQDPNIYYYRKNSAASLLRPEELDESYFKTAKYLHLTGITPALSDSCRATVYQAMKLAKQHNQTTVFDPNIRLKLWSKEEAKSVLNDIAGQVDIVLPGVDEGELMTGHKEPEQIATALLENGARIVVVKLGSKGAYYATKEESAFVAGYQVDEIVDTAGAGDGFAAGFLSGLLRGWDFEQAVQFGNKIGAFALSVAGDMEGYPFWNQVDPEQSQQIISR